MINLDIAQNRLEANFKNEIAAESQKMKDNHRTLNVMISTIALTTLGLSLAVAAPIGIFAAVSLIPFSIPLILTAVIGTSILVAGYEIKEFSKKDILFCQAKQRHNELIECQKHFQEPQFQQMLQDINFNPDDISQVLKLDRNFLDLLSLQKKQAELNAQQQKWMSEMEEMRRANLNGPSH